MNGHELKTVDFLLANGAEIDGLVSVRNPPKRLTSDEAAVIEQASAFPEITYVFFRRVSDGRSSLPVAFVVENEDEHLSNDRLAKLHNDLWLHGTTPLVYVAWPTRIDILTCARGPDFWRADQRVYHPAETLWTASTIQSELENRRRFSALRLADGTFWEDPQNHSLADFEKAAHESLIQVIVETDQALDGEANPLLRRLLLLMVLIKYLEDREVFPRQSWFAHYQKGARCFFDVLKGGEPDNVLRLLRTLEEKFNGDVFTLPTEATLTKKSLRRFATLVEARTLGHQRFLWEQFSFAHLPVEVISHLYQRFVKGTTAVYTPPFLAALLLDYAMPYIQLTGKERVLDPACGSGVFLVGAFRRLVNVWKSNHKWKTPDVETLKVILREQIFGVEVDSNAVDLTAFSLALALCDCLQPNVIWNELRFDPLRNRNILEGDFFDCVPTDDAEARRPIGKFDVIVGNPPFESVFSETATQVDATRINVRGRIPDKQIAYLFLDLGLHMLEDDGRMCLVQPSGFLYNIHTHSFRSFMAQNGRIETILDFTSVRGLFGGAGADPKTVAVILGRETTLPIVHLTFRRTYETKQHIGFELDHYDRHHVTRERAASLLTWKTNLLGGGRLCFLAERLQQSTTLSEFVVKCGWVFGEGYINGVGNPGIHLTGKPLVTPDDLRQTEIDPRTLPVVTETEFLRPRNPLLFEGPLVLIGETLDLPMILWKNGPVAYRNQIAGIHAKPEDAEKHRALFELLIQSREIFQFWVAATSSRAMASMATSILKADIDSLPILEVEVGEPFCEWERILASDVTRYMADFVRLGQNSDLLVKVVDADSLNEYAAVFCRMLGSIYDNLRASEPVFLGSLVCLPFFFGNEPTSEWLGANSQEHLTKLVYGQSFKSLRTIRIIRGYHKNVLFIVKPDRLRYWIRSTAVRDADDTLIDLQQQGY